MGLGVNGGGVNAAKYFLKKKAKVLITDLKGKKELSASIKQLKSYSPEYMLGMHREEDFFSADLIIKNPAVPRDSVFLKKALEKGIPVKTDVQIFFDLCKAKIVGITGTKGKTTTSTLIYLFLKKKYKKVFLAGNMGLSPLDILDKTDFKSIVVLELSSFELEDLDKSPEIAVITNLFEDHLNRYKSFEEYITAKKNIFRYQSKDDFLVLNIKNKNLAKEIPSKTIFFGRENFKTLLMGDHNLENISAASKVAEIFGVEKKFQSQVLKRFKGSPHRQEFVAEKKGVRYYNDTTATNPGSAIESIKTFRKITKGSLMLISGGEDKGMDYKEFCKAVEEKVDLLALIPGSATEKIKKGTKNYIEGKSLKDAVKKVFSLAKKGDVVVLSPASASFNMFANEFDRGRQFISEVKKL
ncbi:MAG: hypothetical protein A2365_01375 [Candidatus Nealsonbacteria bacterium RIFOXYB1_FULL_40_15]|uniref:UDP-N-acetylmuramoylalanine--D-glutamate ligase n=2 Tax=Candidatus Nealsoniibacteriota TaxID=1817911 RepID=A0A1G2ERH4_9BACT|nr:MAG: hypothetical protein A2365_01375 [Candidatus Nealsonbacteria bacterium RIFOXYB1_FULL_40_15]OGZ27878.1 MAG: hypothetical protein A2427_04105 [Candidatus Nealsonbacteria bacterium RIFOXYC1_FULL_40_7]OGZ28038.1 MAG: hypothetical protein A2562_01455 [Candidatus Nealsonbacteria bacterium RIFOXYD1_FULL_39_11]